VVVEQVDVELLVLPVDLVVAVVDRLLVVHSEGEMEIHLQQLLPKETLVVLVQLDSRLLRLMKQVVVEVEPEQLVQTLRNQDRVVMVEPEQHLQLIHLL